MFGRVARLLLVVAAASAVVGAAAREARSDIVYRVDCRTVVADAKLTLGANIPGVQAVSLGGTYGASGCPQFVVDVSVPSYSSGGFAYIDAFRIYGEYDGEFNGSQSVVLPLSQADCGNYVGSVAFYKKSFDDLAFGYVGGGTLHGDWNGYGICHAVKDTNFVDRPAFSPPAWIADTYRIVVGGRVGSSWKQVRAGAQHISAIT